nr:hypothetical protein StreXyl84_27120 [Streptomyces sp. Xyl84]
MTAPGDCSVLPGTPGSSARLLELVALADEEPRLDALLPYLGDPDADVRRAAVDVLTETVTPPKPRSDG